MKLIQIRLNPQFLNGSSHTSGAQQPCEVVAMPRGSITLKSRAGGLQGPELELSFPR